VLIDLGVKHFYVENYKHAEYVKLLVYVRFEVSMSVTMKSTIIWDVMPCRLVKVWQRVGGTTVSSSGSKSKQTSDIQEAGSKQRCL
jgi:hypothetical protein